MKTKAFTTLNLVRTAILSALAAILFLFEFPVFPAVPFLQLDFSNVPVMLGAYAMGPIQGSMILFIKSLTGLLHSSSAGVGELADFIIGMAFVLPGALIYRMKKSRSRALIGLLTGVLTMIVTAIIVNYYILFPFFSKIVPYEVIVSMGQVVFPFVQNIWHFLLTVTASFNFIKGIALCFVTYILYKPLSPLLKDKI